MMWRQTPAARSAGMSQVPKAQNAMDKPAASSCAALAAGAAAICTIFAPATTVIAVAPIATQNGGVRSLGRSGYDRRRAATNSPVPPYRNTPTDHEITASNANSFRPDVTIGSSVAASTATDWLATTQTNPLPFA